MNEGTCVDGIGDFSCQCTKVRNEFEFHSFKTVYEFKGKLLLICTKMTLRAMRDLLINPLFFQGWMGKQCEKEAGGCETSPCQNDADCVNLVDDYFCVCPKGVNGKNCQVKMQRNAKVKLI